MDAKAKLLGVGDHLAFYDLFAPVATGADAAIDWDGANAAVQDAFGGYSPALRWPGQARRSTRSGSTPRSATARAAARSA